MSSLFYMYKNNCKIIQLIQLLVLQLQELQLQQEQQQLRQQKQQAAKLRLRLQAAHWLWLPMQSSRHMNIMKMKKLQELTLILLLQ